MEPESIMPSKELGLVATDELRIAGLRGVLCDDMGFELILLESQQSLGETDLQIVVIDEGATSHLFELLDSFRKLRPSLRLIVFGGDNSATFIERAIEAGARGVLSHTATVDELRMAVQVVLDGSVWAPRRVLSRLLDRAHGSKLSTAQDTRPTKREVAVLQLLMEGGTNREIAARLKVEETTIKAHLGRLMRKAGVENRTALGMHALAEGWILPD